MYAHFSLSFDFPSREGDTNRHLADGTEGLENRCSAPVAGAAASRLTVPNRELT